MTSPIHRGYQIQQEHIKGRSLQLQLYRTSIVGRGIIFTKLPEAAVAASVVLASIKRMMTVSRSLIHYHTPHVV